MKLIEWEPLTPGTLADWVMGFLTLIAVLVALRVALRDSRDKRREIQELAESVLTLNAPVLIAFDMLYEAFGWPIKNGKRQIVQVPAISGQKWEQIAQQARVTVEVVEKVLPKFQLLSPLLPKLGATGLAAYLSLESLIEAVPSEYNAIAEEIGSDGRTFYGKPLSDESLQYFQRQKKVVDDSIFRLKYISKNGRPPPNDL